MGFIARIQGGGQDKRLNIIIALQALALQTNIISPY